MTEEMLDKSELIVLDYLGTQELLQSYTKRPVHVIGLHADTHTRIVRIDERGNTFQERRKRLSADEHEFYSMNDLCDIVVPNRDLQQTVGIIKNFIDFCEETAWVCADDDCLQFRRRVGVDSNKMPVYDWSRSTVTAMTCFMWRMGVYISAMSTRRSLNRCSASMVGRITAC